MIYISILGCISQSNFVEVVIMDIALKYRIVEKIIQSNDDTLLNEIKSLVGLSEGDFWGELPVEVQQAVNKAKAELDRGEGVPHDQVMAEMKVRYLNR